MAGCINIFIYYRNKAINWARLAIEPVYYIEGREDGYHNPLPEGGGFGHGQAAVIW